MIRVSTVREPVTVSLKPPFKGVEITLKRLTSADFAEARQAAEALVRDDARLMVLMAEHELLPDGNSPKAWKRMKDRDPMAYAATLTGISVWVAAVECGLRGITGWTGVLGDDGAPAPVNRPTLEVLMLDEAFSQQVMAELDQAARILVVEGKP
jgi:hypothetical protein